MVAELGEQVIVEVFLGRDENCTALPCPSDAVQDVLRADIPGARQGLNHAPAAAPPVQNGVAIPIEGDPKPVLPILFFFF